MKQLFIFLLSITLINTVKAQCTAPSFTVNLTATTDTTAVISHQTRGGVCCGSSNCVTFLVYANPNSELISFDVTSPSPSGSAYYQVNCGTPVSIGTPLCIVGLASPFTITYCKPGGDSPDYLIGAGTVVHASNDISIQKTGCIDTLFVSNVNTASIVWTSIYPGAQGAYNSYLSCTSGCNSTLVTPGASPPPYIDFMVSGMPSTSCGSFSRDTVRVYFVPKLTGTITPATPVICSSSGTSVTLTANASGGALPYKYDWSSDPGPNNSYTTTVSSAGTYTVIIKDNTKCPALSLTKTIGTIPVTTFSYAATKYCKNTINPTPVFVGSGQPGLFSATPAGLSFVSTSTGEINLAASSSGTYVVTNTISPSGTCPGSSATTTVTIYAFPTMTSASAATICIGGAVNIPLSSSMSSTYSWFTTDNVNTTGESITTQTTTSLTNTITGTINSPQVLIYTVTPTSVVSGSCIGNPQTVSVTVNPKDNPAFTYPSSTNCQTGINPAANITSLTGGTFSANAGGLVFLNAAGTINLAASTIGSYTVTYTTNGACPNSQTFPITITTAPSAAFSYSGTPYCQSKTNPLPTFGAGAGGGSFSVTPAGLAINSLTGEIDLLSSTAGTYTVTNTIAASGGCGVSTATTAVTVTALKSATFSYTASPICQNATNPLPTFIGSGVAGTFTSTAGLNVNAGSGLINLTLSPAGTYTVTNTIAATGGCPIVSETSTITITELPVATFSYTNTPYCQNGVDPLPTFTGGGTAGVFSSSSVFLDINSASGLINLANSTADDYIVVNTIAAANGCPAVVASASVTITKLPIATIAYSGTPYCSNSANPTPTLNVDGTNGIYTYTPSGLSIDANAGTINLAASTAGTYTITNTIAAANGCPAVASSYSIAITQLPSAIFNYSATPFCINGSNPSPSFTGTATAGTFSATAGLSINSSNGSVNLGASSAGTYTVTNTISAANGCPDVSETNTITINPIATASAGTDAVICASNNYSLTGNIGGAATTLSWTTNGNGAFSSATTGSSVYTPSAADIISGNVVLTITSNDPAGPCSSAIDAMTLTINPTPTVSAGSTNTLTCSNTTLSLSSSGTGTYAWSGPGIISGSNTATPVINLPGTYSLVVTSALSCPSSISTVSISQNTTAPSPTASNSTTLTCLTTTASLTGGPASGVTYQWSGPTINGSSITQNAVAGAPGTYTLLVTSTVNGCTNTAVTTVSQNTVAPSVASANTGSLNCTTLSVNASANTSTSPVSYNWVGTGITSASNISTITVNQGGTYNYTVTNTTNNCTTTGSQSIIQNTVAPSVTSANTGSLNCTTLSVNASATTSTSPVSYNWTGTGITSASNISTITVNQGGTYNYTVTNTANNCTTTGSQSIIQNTVSPSVASANTGSLNCTTLSVNASATTSTSPVSYNWTGTGITSASNISTITVNQGGTFNYTVTNTANNCTTTGSQSITQNTAAPVTSASTTGSITCTTNTINLISSLAGMNYAWTAPAGSSILSGSSLQDAVAQGLGTYSVSVLNPANNCTYSTTTSAIQNTTAPTGVTAGSNQSLICGVSSVTLTGTATPTNSSVNWIGGVCGSSTNFTTTACAPGTYTLSVAHPITGCVSTSTVAVVSSTDTPQATVNAVTNSITCTNSLVTVGVTLNNSDPVNYAWSGSGISGASNTPIITTTASGTYSVTITNTVTSCQAIYTAIVPTNTTPVIVTISPASSITCSSPTETLNVSPVGAQYNYSWNGTGITSGGTTTNPVVDLGGNFDVTITNTISGCVGTSTITVPSNTVLPVVLISVPSITTTCANPTTIVNASSTPSTNVTYAWTAPSTGSLTSSTVSNPTASGSGIFTVVVTNTVSGCASSLTQNTVEVIPDLAIPSTTLSTSSVSITCSTPTPSVNLTANIGTTSYSWSPASGIVSGTENTATPSFSAAGTYSAVVTNTNSGCATLSNNNVVTVSLDNTIPVINITGAVNDGTITCTTTSITVTPTITPSSNLTYSWTSNTGSGISSATNQATATFTATGTYTLAITNTLTGCVSVMDASSIFTVYDNTVVPTVLISSPSVTTTCANPTATLSISSTPSTDITYAWTAPSAGALSSYTVSNPVASGSGIFTVVVTNTISGCTSSATQNTIEVIPDAATPSTTLSTSSVSITCSVPTPSVNLTANIGTASYSWSPASGIVSGTENTATPSFSAAGTYSAVVTNTISGCATSANLNMVTVSLDNTIPSITLVSSVNKGTITCSTMSITVTPTITPNSNLTYTWTSNTGSGISSPINQATATFTAAGIYTLAVTNTLTGCVSILDASSEYTVDIDANTPTVSIAATSSNSIIGCGVGNSTVTLGSTIITSSTPIITWLPSNASTPTLAVTSAGVYTLMVVDAVNSCSASSQYTVIGNTNPPQNVDAGTSISTACNTSSVSLNGVTTSTNVNYSWSGPTSSSIMSGSNTSNPIVNEQGNYTLTVTDNLTGCQSTATVNVIQTIVVASFTANPVTGNAPLATTFTNTSIGAINYGWNFGDSNTSTQQNPNNTFTSGTYTVTLTASSGACVSTATMIVVANEVVEDSLVIEIPNVFTPNNDNINDLYEIRTTGVKEVSLQIFNRWGEKLYDNTNAKVSWDGLTQGGVSVPVGTYFYFVKALGYNGKEVQKQGSVSLFR